MGNTSEDIYKYVPLWGNWNIENILGKGSFGSVYKIVREEMGYKYYAAAKIISIPSEEQYREAVSAVDTDHNTLVTYFGDAVKTIVEEIKLLYSLKGNSNIVGYEDHLVIKKEDDIGWDIIIRMELLNPLNKYLAQKRMTRKEIIRLGIDICSALEICESSNIIHRDIKDENIFVSDKGVFKLGDFGIAKDISKAGLAASIRGTPLYMAPEVYRGKAYDISADIYSLGLVLYKLLNYGRLPFMPEYPQELKFKDSERAIDMRMAGEKMSPPALVNKELGEVILKACAYDKSERYSNASVFKEKLQQVQLALDKGELEEEVTILKPLNNKLNTMSGTLKDSKSSLEQDHSLNQTVSIYSDKMPIEQEEGNDLNSTQYIAQIENQQVLSTDISDEMPIKREKGNKKLIAIVSIAVMAVVLSAVIILKTMNISDIETSTSQSESSLVAVAPDDTAKSVDTSEKSAAASEQSSEKAMATETKATVATSTQVAKPETQVVKEQTKETTSASTKTTVQKETQPSKTTKPVVTVKPKPEVTVKPKAEESVPDFSVRITADYANERFKVVVMPEDSKYQYKVIKVNEVTKSYAYSTSNILYIPFSASDNTNSVRIECSIINTSTKKTTNSIGFLQF